MHPYYTGLAAHLLVNYHILDIFVAIYVKNKMHWEGGV